MLDHDTPIEDGFEKFIRARALHVANYLNHLTPHERALVLDEAEVIWDGRRHRGVLSGEAEREAMFFQGQWLAQVLVRLSPQSQAELLEVARRLDESERFERLVDPE